MDRHESTSIGQQNDYRWRSSKERFDIAFFAPAPVTYQALQELLLDNQVCSNGFYESAVTNNIIQQMKQQFLSMSSSVSKHFLSVPILPVPILPVPNSVPNLVSRTISEYYTQQGSPYVGQSQLPKQPKPLGVYLVIAVQEQDAYSVRFSVYIVLRKPGVKVGIGQGTWGFVKIAALIYQETQKIGEQPIVDYYQETDQPLRLVALKYFVMRPVNQEGHDKLLNQFLGCYHQYRSLNYQAALGYRGSHHDYYLYKYYLITGISPGMSFEQFSKYFLLKGICSVRDRLDRILAFPFAILRAYQTLRVQNRLHTDIKTDNIIFYQSEENLIDAKIIDLDGVVIGEQAVSCDSVIGTPKYLPIDLLEAKERRLVKGKECYLYRVNEKTEIYSLGIVIAEIFEFGACQEVDKTEFPWGKHYLQDKKDFNHFIVEDELNRSTNRQPFGHLFDGVDDSDPALIIYVTYKEALFKLVKRMTAKKPEDRPSIQEAMETHKKIIDGLEKQLYMLSSKQPSSPPVLTRDWGMRVPRQKRTQEQIAQKRPSSPADPLCMSTLFPKKSRTHSVSGQKGVMLKSGC